MARRPGPGVGGVRYGAPLRIGLAVIAVAELTSCAASTRLTSSWADSTAAGRSFQKIAVVAIAQRAPRRRMFEDMFTNALTARGLDAVSSYTFAGEGRLDKEAATAKLHEIGAEAVIVTRLVDQQSIREHYAPTVTAYAAPSGYYGDWYGYYAIGYAATSSPGYTVENKIYRLETTLYDVNAEKLLWTGLTESTLSEGDTPRDQVRPIIAALLTDMEKHRVLPRPKEK